MRRCGELVAHIQNTKTQYNLPGFTKRLARKYNHDGVAERFDNPEVRKSVEVDLAAIASLNQILNQLEWHIEKTAEQHDPKGCPVKNCNKVPLYGFPGRA